MSKRKIPITVHEDFKLALNFYKDRENFPFKDEGFLNNTNYKIKYDSNRKTILLVWEGTKTISDGIFDALFFPRISLKVDKKSSCPSEVIFKTAGFDFLYDNIRSKIKSEIDVLLKKHPECKHILQLGHSLGGAIAQQIHFMIMQNYPNIILRTITIGSPRVFYSPWLQPWAWKRWKKLQKMSYNLYLFSNKHDFIPKLPPAFLGLQHINKPIILDDKSNYFVMFTVQNHLEKAYDKSLDRYFGITE